MARFRTCVDCGRRIRGNYTRCYHCNLRRRRAHWHDPEVLEGQESRDAELGRNEFYVYVLGTRYGHYVGHTANVGARLSAHRAGEVESTAGGKPELLWRSRPFRSRRDAARFEAAMKSLRDQEAERFREITGLALLPFDAVPFDDGWSEEPRYEQHRRGGCGLFGLVVITIAAATLLLALALV